MKSLTGLKSKNGDRQEKSNSKKNGKPLIANKQKGDRTMNGALPKNHPYPESGHLQHTRPSEDSGAHAQPSIPESVSRPLHETSSYASLATQERDVQRQNSRSGAPTPATNSETIHSDAGNSRAATTTTHGGALSSVDGVPMGSTFSSPNQSQRSLTTTLTTIQSTGANNSLQGASGQTNPHHHGSLNNPNPIMFSHQYPVSPGPAPNSTISAIPRHVADSIPNTYNSATANGLLSDNASVMTLASSSKRRRRSMDSHTDASVRALAPSSVFGGSRESLPMSLLSGNAETSAPSGGLYSTSQTRPSIGGIASAERASIYSSQNPGIASERNSYYSYKPNRDVADGKSLRSITNIDARSVNTDAKSLGDVASLRNYESSVRSGAGGHSRNDSVPNSIGGPLTSHSARHPGGGLSRRSSDWQQQPDRDEEERDANDDEKRSIEDREEDAVPTTGTEAVDREVHAEVSR